MSKGQYVKGVLNPSGVLRREGAKARIVSYFESFGLPVPDLSGYVGNQTAFTFKCMSCDTVVSKEWQHLQTRGHYPQCRECHFKHLKAANTLRTREPTLQKIRDLTSARGVLCDIDAYVTNKTKLRMVGSCGHPFTMSWNEFSHHKKDGLCQWCAHPRGESHHKWKPELTAEHRAKFEDPNLKTWSRRVLASADWTCDITGERGIELEAHHLSNKADNEDVKFDLSNGVAIAKEFHTLFHSKFYFGKVDNTPEQYAAFKEMIWAS